MNNLVDLKEYYQVIHCFQYYRDGESQRLVKPIELYMLGISEHNVKLITPYEFCERDMLVINFHLNKYPYEKVMCDIAQINKVGDMYEIYAKFVGLGAIYFREMKKSLYDVE